LQKLTSRRNKAISSGLLVALKETPYGPLGGHRAPVEKPWITH